MKTIKTSGVFKKDLKKAGLSAELIDVLYHLQNGLTLPEKYRDHALKGDFIGYRDCHVQPDLVLIYKENDEILELHRLDSHSEIFG